MLNRCYKINNIWNSSHNDLENLTKILNKNQFPTKLINKVTKQYLNFKFDKKPLENKTEVKTDTRFFKLPYIDKYFNIAQKNIQNVVKTFCEDVDIKVILHHSRSLASLHIKINHHFIFKSFIVYKFICANCKFCYMGETTRHFITRINEHLQKYPKSNIFKHLQESRICNSVCNKDEGRNAY